MIILIYRPTVVRVNNAFLSFVMNVRSLIDVNRLKLYELQCSRLHWDDASSGIHQADIHGKLQDTQFPTSCWSPDLARPKVKRFNQNEKAQKISFVLFSDMIQMQIFRQIRILNKIEWSSSNQLPNLWYFNTLCQFTL